MSDPDPVFGSSDALPVQPQTYRVYCRRPFSDPFALNDAVVIAPTREDALEYLLDKGAWRDRTEVRRQIGFSYAFVEETGAPPFNGSKLEWIQAVHQGIYPHELVRLPSGALTQKDQDAVAKVFARKVAPPRQGLFQRVEQFFVRQSQYRRTWKAVGWLLVALAAAGVLYLFWQILLSLATTYIAIRALAAGLSQG